MNLAPGTELGRYRIERCLAHGGMGDVYLGTHIELGRSVAIKVLQDLSTDVEEQASFQQQFRREASLVASLDHPNIAKVSDFFEEGGRCFLVMEYVPGTTLEALVQGQGPLPEAEALKLTLKVLGALEYLHTRQPAVIMRDLKPSNVMLSPDGTCKLIDFGIAKEAAVKSGTRTIIRGTGTPGYAPPEQYGGQGTDARSDLYALGATLYFLLSGVEPPESIARVTSRSMCLVDLTQTRHVSPRVWEWIQKLMQVSPEDRPASTREARALLDGAVPPVRQTMAVAPLGQMPVKQALVPARAPVTQLLNGQPSNVSGSGILWLVIALPVALCLIMLSSAGFQPAPEAPTHEPPTISVPGFPTIFPPPPSGPIILNGQVTGGNSRSVRFLDSKTLAVSTDDGIARFDTTTGRQLRSIAGSGNFGIGDIVPAQLGPPLMVTRDGSVVGRQSGNMFWTLPSGNLLFKFAAAVAISPGGDVLAARRPDGRIALYNTRSQQILSMPDAGQLRAVLSLPDAAGDVEFSPDGTKVAETGQDRALRLWDVKTGALRCTWPAVSGHPLFSPDGRWVACQDADGWQVRVWSCGGTLKRSSGTKGSSHARLMTFSPDGRVMIFQGGTINLVDVETGQEQIDMATTEYCGPDGNATYSPDGSLLAVWDERIHIIEVQK